MSVGDGESKGETKVTDFGGCTCTVKECDEPTKKGKKEEGRETKRRARERDILTATGQGLGLCDGAFNTPSSSPK